MTPQDIRKQIQDIFARVISTNLSVKQFSPIEKTLAGGGVSIGSLSLDSISLKNWPYQDIYSDLDANNSYHIKLADGGLIIFQYTFDSHDNLTKHRLCFFPSFVLPTIEEAPYLYEHDELYGDILLNKIVRFPIRFDFDSSAHVDVDHPVSHFTLGQYENCRIPVNGAVSPNTFLMFVLRNFYARSYRRNKNRFDRRIHSINSVSTITDAERRISHLVNGRYPPVLPSERLL
jgi:hypothetical protein